MSVEQKTIPVASIRTNNVMLRGAELDNPQFVALMDSIRQYGVMTPIQVRPLKDADTGAEYYGIVNGMQRWTASKELGLDDIPAIITSETDYDVLKKQIILNSVQVDTKPVEYTRQLRRLLESDPSLTITALAAQLNKGTEWLNQRLSLTKLPKEIADLVDEGRIVVLNGIQLAALPEELRSEYIAMAQITPVSEFAAIVKQRREAYREANRTNRPEVEAFKPVARIRKFSDIRDASNSVLSEVISAANATSPLEIAKAIQLWVVQLDPVSVATQEKAFNEQQEISKARKEANSKSKAEKQLAQAEAKTGAAKLRLTLSNEGKTEAEIEKAVEVYLEQAKKDLEARFKKAEAAAV